MPNDESLIAASTRTAEPQCDPSSLNSGADEPKRSPITPGGGGTQLRSFSLDSEPEHFSEFPDGDPRGKVNPPTAGAGESKDKKDKDKKDKDKDKLKDKSEDKSKDKPEDKPKDKSTKHTK